MRKAKGTLPPLCDREFSRLVPNSWRQPSVQWAELQGECATAPSAHFAQETGVAFQETKASRSPLLQCSRPLTQLSRQEPPNGGFAKSTWTLNGPRPIRFWLGRRALRHMPPSVSRDPREALCALASSNWVFCYRQLWGLARILHRRLQSNGILATIVLLFHPILSSVYQERGFSASHSAL